MKKVLILLTAIVAITLTSCRKQPTATITTDKTTVEVGGAVKFTSTSVDADHVKWTFPDGQTNDSKEVNYTFTSSGSKTVKLVAYSKKDKKSDEATVTITVDDINKKFTGTWSVTENSTEFGTGVYTMTISASGTNGLSLGNFSDWGTALAATVSGSNFTIPLQTWYENGSGDHDFSGSGSINGNTLTFTHTDDYIDDVDPLADYTDYCSSTGTKQIAHMQDMRTGGKKIRKTVTAIKIK